MRGGKMTRLAWDKVGERFFEVGTDRGVLFVDNLPGVPWNGLISISESSSGGEVTPYYVDSIKYLNHSSSEEFEATIEAYTYPDEFGTCIGSANLGNGLTIKQQKKKSFNLSYRTKVGNDVSGTELGYKIHLIYEATAAPTDKTTGNMNETVDPDNFSWHIVTKPAVVPSHKATSHFVIDSRDTPSLILSQIENILYGTVSSASRIPSVDELLFIFGTTQDSGFDAGLPDEAAFEIFDAGRVTETEGTTLIDGGTP
jgi:hypothetical protein